MDSEKSSIQMSRPKSLRRVNLETCQKFQSFKTGETTTMSPMTNLAQNLSGASLDSTPKRKLSSQGKHLPVCSDYPPVTNAALVFPLRPA